MYNRTTYYLGYVHPSFRLYKMCIIQLEHNCSCCILFRYSTIHRTSQPHNFSNNKLFHDSFKKAISNIFKNCFFWLVNFRLNDNPFDNKLICVIIFLLVRYDLRKIISFFLVLKTTLPVTFSTLCTDMFC